MEIKQTKITSAIYLVRNGKVYLPIKLSKPNRTDIPGVGKRFPYGGKRNEDDKDIFACAKRELRDESGIKVKEDQLKLMGIIEFYRGKEKGKIPLFKVYFFVCDDFKGEPSVDEVEMTDPKPFPINGPFEDLKAGDEFFMIPILQGKKVTGWVWFENDDICLDHEIHEVDELVLDEDAL